MYYFRKKLDKLLIVVLLSTFFTQTINAQDSETYVNSTITDVKVYLGYAGIKHKTTTQLKKGNNTIVISSLPKTLMPKSIQVSGEGAGTIKSVSHRVNYLNKTPKPKKLIAWEDSLKWLDDKIAVVKDEKFVYSQEKTLLLNNNKLTGTEKTLTAAELKSMADLFRTRLKEIQKKLLALEKERKEYKKHRSLLKSQINAMMANRNQSTNEVVINIFAPNTGNAKLNLKYIVKNANWTPSYDIRAKNTRDPIQLNYKASVVNNTGIDWEGINLTLSTADPTVSGYKPNLNNWYLNTYNNILNNDKNRNMKKMKEKSNTKTMNEEYDDDGDLGYGKDDFKTTGSITKKIQTSLTTEFDIPIKYTIPANGKPYQVDIQTYKLSTEFKHSAVPKLEKDAFLMAYMTDWEKLDLLQGPANVYFQSSFIGETHINPTQTKDTLEISLGRDPKILINRKKLTDFTKKKVIGTNITIKYAYEISVKNNKDESIEIDIEDQIPVSQNNSIEIKLLDGDGAKFTEIDGKLKWNVKLKAQESKKFVFKFEVKYPKNMTVYGL